MQTRRRVLASLVSLTLLGGAAACSGTDKPDPQTTADAFAGALATGDLSQLTLSGWTPAKATTYLQTAYKGMDGLRPKITVTSIDTAKEQTEATVHLTTTWTIGAKPWTYPTDVPMKLVDNTWQVAFSTDLVAPDLKPDEELRLDSTEAQRGEILDVAGHPIVTARPVTVVGLDKANTPAAKQKSSAQALAKLVGINPTSYAARVAAAGPKEYVQAITLRQTDPILAKRAQITAVPGALLTSAELQLGPTRTWAQPIIGTVAPATAEQISKSGGKLQAGDVIGQTGLQARYDEQLRGTPGMRVVAITRGADQSIIDKREFIRVPAVDGTPLRLSLDIKAQDAAEAILAPQSKAPMAIVVIDTKTGGILAAASSPGANGQNLAMTGHAPPGSTFKIISSLAMLRKGDTPDTKVACTNTLTVNGRVFKNYSDYPSSAVGTIPLKEALAYSCNTAFISQRNRVSQGDLISAAASLGMGEQPDLGFNGFVGSVPTTNDPVMHAATFIGQGQVEASPLTMATVMASAMSGRTVRPMLVQGEPATPAAAPAVPLTAAESAGLKTEMAAVVSQGSGRRLAPAGVQYAKTGTAEFGTEVPPKTHAWMVAGKGNLAIAFYIEEGAHGTESIPYITDFLKRYVP